MQIKSNKYFVFGYVVPIYLNHRDGAVAQQSLPPVTFTVRTATEAAFSVLVEFHEAEFVVVAVSCVGQVGHRVTALSVNSVAVTPAFHTESLTLCVL